MMILQLDSEQLAGIIKSSMRQVLAENPGDEKKNDRFLSIDEAASFLNLARQTLYGFTSNRTIPFIKKGKKLYFKKSDLEKWLASGAKKTTKEIEAEFLRKEKGGKNG